jgi:hypothetical protein
MYAIFNTIHKIGGYLNYLPVAPIGYFVFVYPWEREQRWNSRSEQYPALDSNFDHQGPKSKQQFSAVFS